MYTMVLMMAVTSGGDVASFGHHKSSCCGTPVGCTGVVASYPVAPTGCTGVVVPTGCTGSTKLGFFAGLHSKLHSHHSCHGGSSCMGSVAMPVAPACGGCPPVTTMPVAPTTTAPVAPPKEMPKTDPAPKPKTESN